MTLITSEQWPFSKNFLALHRSHFLTKFRVNAHAAEQRRLHRILTGKHAPPRVLHSDEKMYVAYRPDSDVQYKEHPELATLSEKWTKNNLLSTGDLSRLYALSFNLKQILSDNIVGDIAELGVYQGTTATLFAHYARVHNRELVLFDTFEGFDTRDLVNHDKSKSIEFTDTSLEYVRDLVGYKNVKFVKGYFPESIPSEFRNRKFCLAHIDCDLYEPAKAGLEFFYPRLSPGGLLIVHDYANSCWDGIKRAVDEYCSTIPERPIIFGDKCGTAMLRKSATL